MKNNFLLILVLFLSSCSLPISILSKKDAKIDIKYDHYYLNKSESLLDLYFYIPYETLIFIKNADGFYSDIIYSIKFKDKNNNVLYSDAWSDSIYLDYFEKTTTSKYYMSDYNFIFDSSMLKDVECIYIEINDYKNHKYWTKKIPLSINGPEILSDLILFVKDNNNYTKTDNMDYDDYSQIDTLWIKYQIIDDIVDLNGVKFELKQNNQNLGDEYLNLIIDQKKIDSYQINLLPIPIDDISADNLVISCYYREIKKEIPISFYNNTFLEYDYQILISPFEYLLEEEDYINYSKLSEDKKIEYILIYWEEIDKPSLFNEFYSRVEHGNLKYKSISGKGSSSDKGKIYIIYGKPINIEYKISQNGDYQEIWIYKNKKFIFINRYGYYQCSNC